MVLPIMHAGGCGDMDEGRRLQITWLQSVGCDGGRYAPTGWVDINEGGGVDFSDNAW
jgi:hypothetical protein